MLKYTQKRLNLLMAKGKEKLSYKETMKPVRKSLTKLHLKTTTLCDNFFRGRANTLLTGIHTTRLC